MADKTAREPTASHTARKENLYFRILKSSSCDLTASQKALTLCIKCINFIDDVAHWIQEKDPSPSSQRVCLKVWMDGGAELFSVTPASVHLEHAVLTKQCQCKSDLRSLGFSLSDPLPSSWFHNTEPELFSSAQILTIVQDSGSEAITRRVNV